MLISREISELTRMGGGTKASLESLGLTPWSSAIRREFMVQLGSYFEGKHVIVTGGSSGIGLAVAEELAGLGAKLSLVARRPDPLAQAKQRLLEAHPGVTVHTLALDVSDEREVERVMSAQLAQHPADMLINNAGVAMPGRFLEQDSRHYREQMDINYFGAVHMCRFVTPHLVERGGGHVANVGSLLSVMGIYGYSAYAASKFALYGFSECLRAELRPHGVKVSMLLPPDTDTPQHAQELQFLPEETKAIAGNVKMLSAASVAKTLLKGMAAGKFELVPGFDGQLTVVANRLMPGVVRKYCDMTQKKASHRNVARPAT